jgi:hypothetical protein
MGSEQTREVIIRLAVPPQVAKSVAQNQVELGQFTLEYADMIADGSV